MTPEQDQFLRTHAGLCVLATGRRDGSPQVSTVLYAYDGQFITVSVVGDRAKAANVRRQPKVGLVVNEGHEQVIVYGTVEVIDQEHPDRITLWRRHRALQANAPAALWGGTLPPPPPADDAEYARQLDEAKRVLLRITPTQVL